MPAQPPTTSAGDFETAPGPEATPLEVQPDLVRASLEQLTASPVFSQSRLLRGFLRFIVDETLEGRAGELKEYVIGVEVFRRKKSYDPRTDPIVRVEAGRLRKKLAEYYDTVGREQRLRIELPKGGYVPRFVAAEPAEPLVDLPAPIPELSVGVSLFRRPWLAASMAAALVVVCCSVYWFTRPRAAVDRPAITAPSARPVVTIAVLPFADLSPGNDQAYFADGLTEELIAALTRVKGLRVASRGLAARMAGLNRDLRQIGRELNATAVLEGSVRKAGDRLRIAVRVSDVATGYTLWAEMYERHVRDVFAVQEDISQKIVHSLGTQLGVAGDGRPILRSHTTNLEAFNLYLKGRYHWNRRGEESLRKAASYFEQAIHEDPRYAAAYSGLADAYGGLAHQSSQAPSTTVPKDKAAALRALELDRDLPEAHASLGRAQIFYDWDFAAAEKSLKRAIEIDPQYATAYQWYSVLLMLANRFDDASIYMHQAEELEPLHPNIKRAAAELLFRRGEYDQAIRKSREALDLDNDLDGAYICLGRSYEQKGEFARAIEAFAQGDSKSNRHDMFLSLTAHAQGTAGRRDAARQLFDELVQRSQRTYVQPYSLAVASAGLGEKERTLDFLERALVEHSVWVVGLPTDRRFDFLRQDVRYVNIVRKLPSLPPLPARASTTSVP